MNNGYVRSPWSWDVMFEVCAKWYLIFGDEFKGTEFEKNVNELYVLSSSEADEIYLNADMIVTFSKIGLSVSLYEEDNGEITGG